MSEITIKSILFFFNQHPHNYVTTYVIYTISILGMQLTSKFFML